MQDPSDLAKRSTSRPVFARLCQLADSRGWLVELHETRRGVLLVVMGDDEFEPEGVEGKVEHLDQLARFVIGKLALRSTT